jgi:hypothetical protein
MDGAVTLGEFAITRDVSVSQCCLLHVHLPPRREQPRSQLFYFSVVYNINGIFFLCRLYTPSDSQIVSICKESGSVEAGYLAYLATAIVYEDALRRPID